MKYLKPILTFIVLSILALIIFTPSSSRAAPRLKEITSIELEYWKWTAKSETSYWDLVFTAKEITPMLDILSGAQPVDKDEVAWFTSSLKGKIITPTAEYEVRFGDEKIARQTYRISITPIKHKANCETKHYHLSRENGTKIDKILKRIINHKITRKPDRIKKH